MGNLLKVLKQKIAVWNDELFIPYKIKVCGETAKMKPFTINLITEAILSKRFWTSVQNSPTPAMLSRSTQEVKLVLLLSIFKL